MALTPLTKGLLVATAIGGIWYAINSYKSQIVKAGSEAVAVDSTLINSSSDTVKTTNYDTTKLVKHAESIQVESLPSEHTQVVKETIKKAPKIKVSKTTKKSEVEETKKAETSNNVIPNF